MGDVIKKRLCVCLDKAQCAPLHGFVRVCLSVCARVYILVLSEQQCCRYVCCLSLFLAFAMCIRMPSADTQRERRGTGQMGKEKEEKRE